MTRTVIYQIRLELTRAIDDYYDLDHRDDPEDPQYVAMLADEMTTQSAKSAIEREILTLLRKLDGDVTDIEVMEHDIGEED
jgi:hypothetical protein